MKDNELEELQTEEEFLQAYDLRRYTPVGVTTDLAIFTIIDDQLSLLLIERVGHPHKGKWALPGGFVNGSESLEEAAQRELREETGGSLEGGFLEQLETYGRPGRDPRGYIVSTAYVALIPQLPSPEAGDDAAKARYFPVSEVLSGAVELAFDHREIIEDGLERVRTKLEYSPVAPLFLKHEHFTISELRRVYEIVWGVELNTSNFRRKVQSVADFLKPVPGRRASELAGGRSSDLYSVGAAEFIYPPLRRIESQ